MKDAIYYVIGFIIALITTIIVVIIINKKQLKTFEKDMNTAEENINENNKN